MSDDAILLRQFASNRSEEAFRELLRRHLPLVYSAARRLLNGDTHAAEDVSQRVFFDLANRAGTVQRTAALSGWLLQRTRSLAKNRVRTDVRRRSRESEAASLWTDQSGAGDHWTRLSPLLDDALASLSRADRDVLLLRYYEKRDLRSVGKSLGISDDTAQKRVCRALDRLRGLLMSRGLTLGASLLAGCLAEQSGAGVPPGLEADIAGNVPVPAVPGGGLTGVRAHVKACALGLTAACVAGGVATWWPLTSPAVDPPRRAPLAAAAAGAAGPGDVPQPEEGLKPGAALDEILARIRKLATLPDTRRNKETLHSLLDLISPTDWPEMAAQIMATGHKELWLRCQPGVMQRWGDTDAAAALSFCMAHTGGSQWEREFYDAFLAWHPRNPAAAVDGLSVAIKEVTDKAGPRAVDPRNLSRVIVPLLKLLPGKVDAFIAALPTTLYLPGPMTLKEDIVRDLNREWPELPPEAVLKALTEFAEPVNASYTAEGAFRHYLTRGPVQSRSGAGAFANQLVMAKEAFRSEVAPQVAIAWLHKDEAAALAWMNEALTPGEQEDVAKRLASSALSFLEQTKPDTREMALAMRRAADLHDPAAQENTLSSLYRAWKRANSEEAESFLQGTGWQAERVARIQSAAPP